MPIENYVRKNYFKIILAGNGAVGKTTLSKRLTGTLKKNERIEMTPGVDFHILKIKKNVIHLQLWDLGGQDQFRYFQNDFFGGATVVILIYSVDSWKTFNELNTWLEFIPEEMYKNVYLIGNKIDLKDEKKIILPMAEHLSQKFNAPFFETSALTGENVSEIFHKIAELTLLSKLQE